MRTANSPTPSRRADQGARTRWPQDVASLISDVQQWSLAQGWAPSVQEVTLMEGGIGTYSVPVLTVKTTTGTLTLEPIAYETPGSDGRVDIYAYPSLSRMLLLRRAGSEQTEWTLRTNDGLNWPEAWSEQVFAHIARGLLGLP